MDIEECRSLLLNKAQQFDLQNAEVIIGYIVTRIPLAEIRLYLSSSDEQIHTLFDGVNCVQQFLGLPPQLQQPPSRRHGLPFANWKRHFHPRGSICGFHAPSLPIGHIGTQEHQLVHPVINSQGILGPSPPIGPNGAFQSPFSESIGLRKHFQSLSTPGDAMPSNRRSACRNITISPPSGSKGGTKPCDFHFYKGYCKNGVDCRFSHESGFPDTLNERQVYNLRSLHMLEMEIRELLLSQRSSPVPIEHLENMYFDRYLKPLEIEGFHTEGQQNVKAGYGLTDLLIRFNTTRVIKRQGQHHIVLVEDAPKYLAVGFKSVMPPASSDSNQIYITFTPESKFTEEDVRKYFSQYGAVNVVRIPPQERCMFGFVSFLHPGTVKRVLSERSARTPHVIGGDQVLVKAYKERHELEMLSQKDAHSNYGVHKVPDVSVILEHPTGEDTSSHHESFRAKKNNRHDLGFVTYKSTCNIAPEMASPPTHNLSAHFVNEAGPSQGNNKAESSHLSNLLDEASADQDSDDFGLPKSLDV